MSAKLIIDKGIVTQIYHAEKSGRDYLTVTDGESTFNFGSGKLDLSKTPIMTFLRIEAEIKGSMFAKNQVLTCVSFKVTPVTNS